MQEEPFDDATAGPTTKQPGNSKPDFHYHLQPTLPVDIQANMGAPMSEIGPKKEYTMAKR